MTPEQMEAEAQRSAQVDRLLAQMGEGGPMILDVRSQRLLVEHVRALEGHVGELAQACLDAEAKAKTDDRTIAQLAKDLEAARQGEARALSMYDVAAGAAENEAGKARALQVDVDKLRAERDAALARLSEPRGCQERSMVIELGARIL